MKTRVRYAAATLAAILAAAWIRRAAGPRFTFRDAAVVIVGGGRGLGLELAREAGARGARVGLLARSELELLQAQSDLRSRGVEAHIAVGDVRDEGLGTALEALAHALGPIDVLVNDAGIIQVGPVDALSFSDYRNAIETNYLGAVRAVEAVRPAMQQRRRGRIVNISSIGGKVVVPHLLPYCAAKFALAGYSEGLRAELARYGIVVTTVIPGLMRTGSPPHASFVGQPTVEYELFAISDALPFTSISVGEAARAILDGCARGDIETVVSRQAKLAAAAYGFAPRAVVSLMTLLGRLLPDSGGSTEHRTGFESETPLTQSPLTALSREATQTQNEALDPTER